MKVKNLFVGLTAVLPLFAAMPSSANDAASACDALIQVVKVQLADTDIEENSRKKNGTVREGLNDKLDNASYK